MTDLHRRYSAALLFGVLLTLPALHGCGDDDDDPVAPGPPQPQDFTEDIAVNQTLGAVDLVNGTLDALPGYANGVGAKVGDDDFVYDEADDRWEAVDQHEALGYAWDVEVYVQYLNEAGLPEQDVEDAEQMRYGYSGTAHYDAGGVVIHQTHDALLSVTGLNGAQGDTLTVFGGGEYTMDYTRTENDVLVTTRHDATWDLGDDGVVLPDLGCPAGTVDIDFDPYELRLEYDGTPTAAYTLVDEQNDAVPEGTGTTTITCGP